jgi:outer membrane protein
MMRKKILVLISFMVFMSGNIFGARLFKVGYVDQEEVFNTYPGTADVRQKLKEERDKSQVETDKKKEEIAVMEKDFELNSDKLSDMEKQKRLAEIDYKKELLSEFIDDANKKLIALRDELSKPVYLKIQTIIQRVSAEKGFSFVFRKGSDALLYMDKEYDLTKDIVLRLKKEVTIEER